MHVDQRLARLALKRPDILLPRQDRVDLRRWAVIACDQHTSNRRYWEDVAESVGDAPSSLGLVFPEVYLEERPLEAEAARIGDRARSYLEERIFEEHPATPILVLRENEAGERRPGVLFALDLEAYEYAPGSRSLVRASELTIEERLPPRVLIREHSPLELPHILVLIDDEDSRIIEPLAEELPRDAVPLYKTELMAGGGTVTGYPLGEEILRETVLPGLESLRSKRESFLFAAGDGNHSLASAKEVWRRRKAAGAPMDHPSRWALVEIVNLYTPALRFEPIHRLLLEADLDALTARLSAASQRVDELPSPERGSAAYEERRDPREVYMISQGGSRRFRLTESDTLPVAVVDDAIAELSKGGVDYVHGSEESRRLAVESGGAAILLPPIERTLLFKTVEQRGVLPRKAFSLGESEEKRYYMEARRIE